MNLTVNIPTQVSNHANLAAFPVTGALKTIYITEDTNLQYRWTGSAYQLLSEGTGGGVESVTGDGVNNTDPLNPVLSFPTPIDIGLGNVDNTSDEDKPVSTEQATADALVLSTANTYTDNQISSAVAGLLDDRGNYDASGNVFPSTGGSGTAGAILKGDLWTISVAGTLGGNAVTVGDVVRALVDSPAQTSSNWAVTENNIGYVPENAANKSTSTSDFASSTKFPVWSAIVSFFDGAKILSLLGISSISGTNTGDETAERIGTIVNGATAYTTPLDADKVGIWDAANSLFKATTWANFKATLKAYFDTKYTNILYSSTADSTATSGTSNTLCSSFLVASNIFTSTNRLRITIRTTKSNTLGICTLRVYTNNLADLSGATLIGTYASSAAHQIIGTVFNYPFKSSTTIQRISATFTLASDEQGGGVSLAPVTFTFNTASNNYLLFALQNANGTESSVISYLTIEKL